MTQAKILVIEDETIVAVDIARGLRRLGFEVVAAAGSGEAALGLAATHRPELVLMDIRLKGAMDGIDAGRQIRRELGIPIVFLTAYADPDTVERAKSAEPFGYLLKPFEDQELHTTVEIALHKRATEKTVLHDAREALRLSEQRYRHLLENLPDYAIFLLDPQGRVASWNSGAERIKGYTEREVLGRHFSLFFPPEQVLRNAPEKLLWKAFCEGRAQDEGWRLRKDGSLFWGDSALTALRDEDGTLVGFARITHDLTDKKNAEEQIRQLNATLERKVRERTAELHAANRELEAFTYSVAHDLRAPLRGLNGFLLLLQEEIGPRLTGQALEALSRGQSCAIRMSRLIDELLDLSRVGRQVPHWQDLDLGRLVQEVIAELKPETADRLIQWQVEPLPIVRSDAGLLKQVLLNLLGNAVKYTRTRQQPRIQIGLEHQADHTIFFVGDNGVGFDMAFAHKLFQPFSRLHSEQDFPGVGVGLAIVERIIRKHGGRVWAEAQPGHGATFFFTLNSASAAGHPITLLPDAEPTPEPKRSYG